MYVEVKNLGDDTVLVLSPDLVRSARLKVGQCLRAQATTDGLIQIGPYDEQFDKGIRIMKEAMVEYRETQEALAKS